MGFLKDLDKNARDWQASQVGQKRCQEEVNEAFVLKQIALHEREAKIMDMEKKLATQAIDMELKRFQSQDKLAKVKERDRIQQTRFALEKQMMMKGLEQSACS